MIVMKFGGGTLSTSERLERCLDHVESHDGLDPVVVVSAHGKTTDRLIELAHRAVNGEIRTGPIRDYHHDLAAAAGVASGMIDSLLDRLESLLHGIGLLKELTPRTLDHVMSFGERLSSRIVAGALAIRGLKALPVCAYDIGLVTDARFGDASPLEKSDAEIRERLSGFEGIPVITGFIGKNQEGDITTLGRSGSDFTATYIGGAVGAEEVIIYKDVDGVMTADPTVDDSARNIPELSFEEASELAYFGAEVLHPATLLPAIKMGVPVRVINAMKDGDVGTAILSRPVKTKAIAKSIVYKEDVTLLHLDSHRLHSVPRVLSDALAALEGEDIIAHMITTSEAGISLITQSGLDEKKRKRAVERLTVVAPADATPHMAIICVVGEELKGRADSVGRIFESLSKAGINARVITRAASEINVAFLVTNEEISAAVKALHELILQRFG
jgi:aspartate kinase